MTRYSVNNNTCIGLVISLCSNSNHLISLIPPKTAADFRHLLSCGTIVVSMRKLFHWNRVWTLHALTLSNSAFQVSRLARGREGLSGPHLKMLGNLWLHCLTEMKFSKSNCKYLIMYARKFEFGSYSILEDMTSQSYPSHEGNDSLNSVTYPWKMSLTWQNWVFMSRIVLFDPK